MKFQYANAVIRRGHPERVGRINDVSPYGTMVRVLWDGATHPQWVPADDLDYDPATQAAFAALRKGNTK